MTSSAEVLSVFCDFLAGETEKLVSCEYIPVQCTATTVLKSQVVLLSLDRVFLSDMPHIICSFCKTGPQLLPECYERPLVPLQLLESPDW